MLAPCDVRKKRLRRSKAGGEGGDPAGPAGMEEGSGEAQAEDVRPGGVGARIRGWGLMRSRLRHSAWPFHATGTTCSMCAVPQLARPLLQTTPFVDLGLHPLLTRACPCSGAGR